MKLTHRPLIYLFVLLIGYGIMLGPFTAFMARKPIEEKLGFVPSIKLMRPLSADHKEFVGAMLIMKVIMYFGGLADKQSANVMINAPDYQGMSRIIHGALTLDPYNMDGYYFAQAFLVWDAKQINVANDLLDYGMKYRTWDWYLPFFAGFNNAYFLKDYAKAAVYYKRAAEITGDELHINLAGRYLKQAGQTDFAISYLKVMARNTNNKSIRKAFQVRIMAFEGVRKIEKARDSFVSNKKRMPLSISELLQTGYLSEIPVDPYGGTFFINKTGEIDSTSKFSYAGAKVER